MKAIRWLLKLVLVIMTLPLILAVWLAKWFVVFLHHCSAWIFYLLGSVLLATAILSYLMQQSQGVEALQMLIGGFVIFMIPQVVGSVVVLLELAAVMLRQVWYMRRLGMWAAGYDCAIVLIGHLNKKEGSKGLYRSLGSIDVVAAARSVLQVERDTENPDIRIVHQIKNSLAPTAEDIRFSISADKGFQWLECRPQSFENQKPDRKPEFESEQQKAVYWIKHFLEKGDMSANEIYCRLDNEGVSKRVARMVKTEMGIHCYQKKRRWYWSVQPEEGAVNGPQV